MKSTTEVCISLEINKIWNICTRLYSHNKWGNCIFYNKMNSLGNWNKEATEIQILHEFFTVNM